MNKRS